MGVEGRSRDSAVFTAITHMWSLINEMLEYCHFNLHTAVTAFYNLKLATAGWLSALSWLQQCLFGCRCHALHLGPFQPNWSPVTLTATKGRKASGTPLLSPPL